MGKRIKEDKGKLKVIRNIIIAIIGVILIAFILRVAPDYMRDDIKGKVNLVINNNNVTGKMKKDVYVDEKGIIYLSKEDIKNYFDKYIEYDKETKRITTTSDAKVATMIAGEKTMTINGSNVSVLASMTERDGTIYLPFSEMANRVYNLDLNYNDKNGYVVVDSLDRELKKADVSKNVSVKYKAKNLCKTIEKLKKGDKVVYISSNKGWAKIRTESGRIGYVKEKAIANITNVRQAMEDTSKVDGKVNLVWDYYSEYAKAPDRTGQSIEGVNVVSPSFFSLKKESGEILDNAGEQGKKYIDWAHQNGYKVWAMFSNNSLLETTSKILNDYEKREELIDKIVKLAEQYGVDGINLDFENMKEQDKNVYSRLVIELAPRLKDTGKTLSVDVTAPDGSETWSLCFDRNIIGDVADYIVFMAYDQYGQGSKEGTTAGYNWVEANINKFLGQEEVEKEKIILGIPLYTRLWKEEGDKTTSKTVDMKKVDTVLPSNVDKKWDDELKQYYVEYKEQNVTYKMWVEDEKSIKEKIGLANKYKLAGIAFWEKDRETEGLWSVVKEELNKE